MNPEHPPMADPRDHKLPMRFEKGIIFRLLLAAALGCAAVGLFLLERMRTDEDSRPDFAATLQTLDHQVDSVLAQFGIDQQWIRKRRITIPGQEAVRIERRIAIPAGFAPVLLNAALNSMARRHNGRAIATEDLKQSSVTVYIEMQKVIVQTIILKTDHNLRAVEQKSNQATP